MINEDVDSAGNSTPICAGVESGGFSLKEAVSHNSVRYPGGIVNSFGLLLCQFLSHFNSVLTVFCMGSHIGHYVTPFKLVLSVRSISRRWRCDGVFFQCTYKSPGALVGRLECSRCLITEPF